MLNDTLMFRLLPLAIDLKISRQSFSTTETQNQIKNQLREERTRFPSL